MSVGIERIRVWPGSLALDMRTLVEARGGNVGEVVGQMMIDARTVCPPWEDAVTMAVEAGRRCLAPGDRERVRWLIVASESGPDQEKALSTWAHRWLDLPDDVRHVEIKSACYGGTAALQLAAAWIAGQPDPDATALVLTTDLSRAHFGKPWEFVMGGGATAMLVSRDPRFLALEPGLSGAHAHEVSDLFRPTSRVEAGHSETSLLSYLDAVDLCADRYRAAVRRRTGERIDSVDALRAWAPHAVYHAPFGGITLRAHRAVLRTLDGFDAAQVAPDFEARIAPTLAFGRRMGGVYAGSPFVSLCGLAASGRARPGERVLIYSYGSGSCAEMYSGVLGPDAPVGDPDLPALLDARRVISVEEYERIEQLRTDRVDTTDYDVVSDDASAGRLVFRGVRDWVREYGWAPCA